MVLPNPAGLSAEPAVRYPQQGGTIWIFFPNRRNEENLTNLERLQRAQSCTTFYLWLWMGRNTVWKKNNFLPLFFPSWSYTLFLECNWGKKKQTQELMNILVKIIIIEPRRASCTEIRLFAILPPSKGTCQPFSSWVLWMGSSQSSLLQLYKQLNINWTRKADWPCGEKRDSPGTRGPSSALSFEPAKVNLPDLLLSCWPWSPGIFYLYCCCLMSPLLSDLLNIKQLLFPQN